LLVTILMMTTLETMLFYTVETSYHFNKRGESEKP